MKQNHKTLLAAVIMGVIALAGNSFAQTTTGTVPAAAATPDPNAGTYKDATLTPPQRIELAKAVADNTESTPQQVKAAAQFMLDVRPVIHLVNTYGTFADSVIADPTLGGRVEDTFLKAMAVQWKVQTIPALDDKIAYLADKLELPEYDASQVLGMKSTYGNFVIQKATAKLNARDYAGAIETATPVLGFTGANAGEVNVIFKAKMALRASDVLSWAKLVYFKSNFNQSQTGIDAVGSAFRALDGNLVREDAFRKFQQTGEGTNPLAGVAFPNVAFLGNSAHALALNAAIAGDNLGALKIAFGDFSSATIGDQLNNAGNLVAQWLRNLDGNFVRANAFSEAQTNKQPFTITELK